MSVGDLYQDDKSAQASEVERARGWCPLLAPRKPSSQNKYASSEEPSDLTAGKRIDAERRCPTRALNEPYVEKEA